MRVAGIVLAGGLSRRMGGGDKCLRVLAGRPMLSVVIDRLRPQVECLALNANGDPERFSGFGLPVIPDPIDGFAGPLCGILAGMNWASEAHPGVTHVVSAASDTPFFPGDLVQRLVNATAEKKNRVVLASTNGRRHPVFGLWPVALEGDLSRWMAETDRYKVLDWVGRHDNTVVDFPSDERPGRTVDPFFNVNTKEDLAVAESILREDVS